MIRSLRYRFISGAMAAFVILIVLLILGTSGFGYLHLQYQKNLFLNEALEMEYPKRGASSVIEPYVLEDNGVHSHDQDPAASYCLIDFDTSDEIIGYYSNGMRTLKPDQLKTYVAKIRSDGTTDGEVDGYIYRIRSSADSTRIAIMDFCLQEETYHSMLGAVIYLSLGCSLLLLVILLPISKRVALSYASAVEKQRQFLTNAGHDLKTPVAIIRSNIEAHELINGENKFSRNAHEQTVRLNKLIEQMLYMARMDEGRIHAPFASVNLAALIRDELATYQELLESKQLRLQADIPDQFKIYGNREALLQLLHILLDNATKYSNTGGTLKLSLGKKKPYAQLVLENSTEALPDCPAEKLFERFFRPDIARTQKTGGSGIGLAAAQDIVRLHRGRIEARYNVGPSIRFTIELPLR